MDKPTLVLATCMAGHQYEATRRTAKTGTLAGNWGGRAIRTRVIYKPPSCPVCGQGIREYVKAAASEPGNEELEGFPIATRGASNG